MQHHVKSRFALVASLLAVTALTAGCWDDDDDDDVAAAPTPPAAANAVPTSAAANTVTYVTYLGGLVAAPSETGEPLDTSAFTPPVDDTAEPFAI